MSDQVSVQVRPGTSAAPKGTGFLFAEGEPLGFRVMTTPAGFHTLHAIVPGGQAARYKLCVGDVILGINSTIMPDGTAHEVCEWSDMRSVK
jgi:hypothetical protein